MFGSCYAYGPRLFWIKKDAEFTLYIVGEVGASLKTFILRVKSISSKLYFSKLVFYFNALIKELDMILKEKGGFF